MLESPTAIANNLRSAGKSASSSRPPRGRASLNTIVTQPPKKRMTSTIPDPSNNTDFDKLDYFLVFQEKKQHCRKCQTDYSFIKCEKY